MKAWLYILGLLLLPAAYVGLMLMNQQPIEWSVLALMALIILPIVVFRKRIGAVEKQFNAMSDEDKLKTIGKAASTVARRSVGSD